MLMKTREAAKQLGISVITLRRWLKAGWGPPVIKSRSGMFRFSDKDLQLWTDKHRQEPKEQSEAA